MDCEISGDKSKADLADLDPRQDELGRRRDGQGRLHDSIWRRRPRPADGGVRRPRREGLLRRADVPPDRARVRDPGRRPAGERNGRARVLGGRRPAEGHPVQEGPRRNGEGAERAGRAPRAASSSSSPATASACRPTTRSSETSPTAWTSSRRSASSAIRRTRRSADREGHDRQDGARRTGNPVPVSPLLCGSALRCVRSRRASTGRRPPMIRHKPPAGQSPLRGGLLVVSEMDASPSPPSFSQLGREPLRRRQAAHPARGRRTRARELGRRRPRRAGRSRSRDGSARRPLPRVGARTEAHRSLRPEGARRRRRGRGRRARRRPEPVAGRDRPRARGLARERRRGRGRNLRGQPRPSGRHRPHVWERIPDEGARALPALLVPCDDLGAPGDVDFPDDVPEAL